MKFLENLDALLHSRNMTRSDLARAIDVAPSTVNAWFNRSCDGVVLKNLVKIADYFGISLDELVNGDAVTSSNLSKEEVAQVKRLLAYYEKLDGGKE